MASNRIYFWPYSVKGSCLEYQKPPVEDGHWPLAWRQKWRPVHRDRRRDIIAKLIRVRWHYLLLHRLDMTKHYLKAENSLSPFQPPKSPHLANTVWQNTTSRQKTPYLPPNHLNHQSRKEGLEGHYSRVPQKSLWKHAEAHGGSDSRGGTPYKILVIIWAIKLYYLDQ